jgi:hypothetical protein
MKYTTDIAHCEGSGVQYKKYLPKILATSRIAEESLYARSQCIPYTIGEYDKKKNKCIVYRKIE